MKIIPAGKYESALVRLVDAVTMPDRNSTGHPYYMDLNRSVDRKFTDGIGAFAAIANETIVPWELDWGGVVNGAGEQNLELGVSRSSIPDRNDDKYNDNYRELDQLIDQISKSNILSRKSFRYVTALDLSEYPNQVAERWENDLSRSQSELLRSYLRRLMHQIYTASSLDTTFLLIAEPDIQIVAEVGQAIVGGQIKTSLPFPDLRNRLLEPDAFAHGILNFSAKDAQTIEKVRADKVVQLYSQQIRAVLARAPAGPNDPAINEALIDAYYHSEVGRTTQQVFEIGTWLVKPLHYVPVVGEILSVAEDIKDVVNKAADQKLKKVEWFLIGVRMHEVAIRDYLSRLDNKHTSLRNYRNIRSE